MIARIGPATIGHFCSFYARVHARKLKIIRKVILFIIRI